MAESRFVYVTYIRTTPEKLWRALLDPEFTRRYWCETRQESDWKPGASWRNMAPDGRVADAGEVVEIEPHKRLKRRHIWALECTSCGTEQKADMPAPQRMH